MYPLLTISPLFLRERASKTIISESMGIGDFRKYVRAIE